MKDLLYHAGRIRWIEARADVLTKLRGLSPGTALAQAKEEFARFAQADRKSRPATDIETNHGEWSHE